MRVHLDNALLIAGVILLGLPACGSPHDADLFRSSGTLSNSGGTGSASGASSLPDASGSGGAIASAGNPDSSGGGGSSPANGGAASDAGMPAGGAYASAGGDNSGGAIEAGATGQDNSECAHFGPSAVYSSDTQHCYLLVPDLLTFAAAEVQCKTLGAHLLTLTDSAENDFAWALHSDEHWIGATDGKGPKQPDPGTYTWVTDESFSYTNWSSGQPNAADTDCGDTGIVGHCYEHCAFQWKGGERDGQWNDRFCLHTIASICEWDGVN